MPAEQGSPTQLCRVPVHARAYLVRLRLPASRRFQRGARNRENRPFSRLHSAVLAPVENARHQQSSCGRRGHRSHCGRAGGRGGAGSRDRRCARHRSRSFSGCRPDRQSAGWLRIRIHYRSGQRSRFHGSADPSQLTSGLLFFATGADRLLVRALSDSLRLCPPESFALQKGWAEALIRFSSLIFTAGLRLAAPVIALLLLASFLRRPRPSAGSDPSDRVDYAG